MQLATRKAHLRSINMFKGVSFSEGQRVAP